MPVQHPPDSDDLTPTTDAADTESVPADASPRTEDIHVRNYDVERAYTVDVTVRRYGTLVFEESYHLQPGAFLSELDALPPGEYEVRAELDTGRSDAVRCTVGDTPDEMALVEVGNWNVSVGAGLY